MKKIKNPVKAIRENCIQCIGSKSIKEVENCGGEETCPLYPFRFGKNPYRTKRVMSDEHKLKLVEAMKNARIERERNDN
jgi:hypothetical protein